MNYQSNNKNLKAKGQWLIGLSIFALISVIGGGIYLKTTSRTSSSVAAPSTTAELDTVQISINESGIFKLGDQQTLTSPADSAVEHILVKIGDPITAGQVLVTLRNADVKNLIPKKRLEIQNKALSLASNRQKLAEALQKQTIALRELQSDQSIALQKQELSLELARHKVIEATARLENEQQKLRELEALDKRGFIAKDELKGQQVQVGVAQSTLRETKSSVVTASLDLKNLQQQLRDKVVEAQSAVEAANLAVRGDTVELQRLQLELKETEQQIQNSVVISPIKGKVLDILVKPGNGVTRGKEMLVVGDSAQELAWLNLSPFNARKVRVGQTAQVNVIGSNQGKFTGKVVSVSPYASQANAKEFGSNSSQPSVQAIVKLSRPSGQIFPGSKVNVEIVVAQRQNVVTLPSEAIQNSGDTPFVWVQDPQGHLQKRSITLGLEGLTTTEIKSGLRPGETVTLPSPQANQNH